MEAIMAPSVAHRFAVFADELQFDDMPPVVVTAAKLHLLDTIGVGYAAHALGLASHGRELIDDLGGHGAARIIGGGTAPAANAALVNGMLCHALDFDDTHPASICHVGTAIVPPAMGVAGERHATGRELITALVLGAEIMIRIGLAAKLRLHPRGFHPTATCGCFAAATIAGRLMRLPADRITSALGIAGSMASGLFVYLDDGTPTKPIHAGWAAHAGIAAALLAAAGGEGPPRVFEGRYGFYAAYADTEEPDLSSLDSLGEHWELPAMSYKTYPACHILHGPLTALDMVLAEREIDAGDVDEVLVSLEPQHVPFVAEPVAAKLAPRTGYEAKFSVQYAVARRLIAGHLSVEHFERDAFRDARVLELARRVDYETRHYDSYPASFPGGVRVRLRDGTALEAHAPHPFGDPLNPASEGHIRGKFRRNAALALDPAAVDALESAILSLEERASVDDLLPGEGPATKFRDVPDTRPRRRVGP
jgi:2-methylcitrate dehydratase PrpD